MPRTASPRSVSVFDTPSGLGGSHTVSILAELAGNRVRVRVWYRRATPTGWDAWKDWDGVTFETERSALTKERTMPLFRTVEGADPDPSRKAAACLDAQGGFSQNMQRLKTAT